MSQNNNNSQIKKEIHFEELSQVEKGKVQFQKTLKAYLTVILGTLIYSFGVVWILRLGGFFSGGATGASQLIVGLFEKFNPNGSKEISLDEALHLIAWHNDYANCREKDKINNNILC